MGLCRLKREIAVLTRRGDGMRVGLLRSTDGRTARTKSASRPRHVRLHVARLRVWACVVDCEGCSIDVGNG